MEAPRGTRPVKSSPFSDVGVARVRGRTWAAAHGLPRTGEIFSARDRKVLRYHHFGLYLGDGTAIHFSGDPLAGEKTKPTIRRDAIKDVIRGRKVIQVALGGTTFTPGIRALHAVRALGSEGYNLVANNCEHFVFTCALGWPVSRQVENKISAGLAAGSALPGMFVAKGVGAAFPLAGPAAFVLQTALSFAADASRSRSTSVVVSPQKFPMPIWPKSPVSTPIMVGVLGRAGKTGWACHIPVLAGDTRQSLVGWGIPSHRDDEWEVGFMPSDPWQLLASRRVGCPTPVGTIWLSSDDGELYFAIRGSGWHMATDSPAARQWLADKTSEISLAARTL